MSDLPLPETPKGEPGDSFLRVLFSWPNVIVVVIIGLIAFIAMFNAEENWRGQRAWNKYRKALEAQGESFDLNSFIPVTIPSEENFASTPLVRSWFPRGNLSKNDGFDEAVKMIPEHGTNRNEGERHFLDLVAWEMAFNAVASGAKVSAVQKFQSDKLDFSSRATAAPAVLNALTNNQEDFDELREASRRPHSRYPITYDLEKPWGILLPHLSAVRQLCDRLELKACAELAAGHGENGLADVKLLLYLADSLKDESFLISHLVRLSLLQNAVQPIWEGLAEQQWDDAQLRELEKQISQYNFVRDEKRALRGDRAFSISTIHSIGENRKLLSDAGNLNPGAFESQAGQALIGIIPGGWFFQEQISYCQIFQDQFGEFLKATNHLISPSQVRAGNANVQRILDAGESGFIVRRLLSDFMPFSVDKSLSASARAQVAFDQAAIACALERYRITNGRFPENLETLVPRFAEQLPSDVLSGEPYKYRREGNSFILYSPGWNEKDDGGVPGDRLFDENKGDWIWRYPNSK